MPLLQTPSSIRTPSFISRSDVLEDSVIDVLARDLRARGGAVLAEGGNQMRAFRFITISGRRKAPDLVVYLRGVLAVFEAKVRPGDLFRKSNGASSDYDVISQVANDLELQRALIDEAKLRLSACGRSDDAPHSVCAGLIAAGSIVASYPSAAEAGLLLVNVDTATDTYVIETGMPAWNQSLIARE